MHTYKEPGYDCKYCHLHFYDLNVFKYHSEEKVCVKLKELICNQFECIKCNKKFISDASNYIAHVDKCYTCDEIGETELFNINRLDRKEVCLKCLRKFELKSTVLYHTLYDCNLVDFKIPNISNILPTEKVRTIIPFGSITSLSDYSAVLPEIEDILKCALFDREGETIQYMLKSINCSIKHLEFINAYIDITMDKRICAVYDGSSYTFMRRSKIFDLIIENFMNLIDEYIELYHDKFTTSEGKEKIKIYNSYVKDVVLASFKNKEKIIETDITAILCNASQYCGNNNNHLLPSRNAKKMLFSWDEIAITIIQDAQFFINLLKCIKEHINKTDQEAIDFILITLYNEFKFNHSFLPVYIPMLRIEHNIDPNWEEELFYNYFENNCKIRIDIFI